MLNSYLEVADSMHDANDMARSYLEERGEARGRGKDRRLSTRAGEIRHGAAEAARVVANLLSEAGVVGRTLGQTQPPLIRTIQSRFEAFRAADALFLEGLVGRHPGAGPPDGMWRVVPNGPGPVRVGAFVVTWDRFEPSPTLADVRAVGAGYTRDIQVDVKIEADPPLTRSVPIMLGWGFDPQSFVQSFVSAVKGMQEKHTLPDAARLYHLKETVTMSADADGNITETPIVHIGAFEVGKPSFEIRQKTSPFG